MATSELTLARRLSRPRLAIGTQRTIFSGLSVAFLAVVVFLVLFPLANIVFVSLLDRAEVLSETASFWPPTFSAYERAWTGAPFPRYFLNSLIVCVAVTLGSTVSAILAAYVFARSRFFGRDFLFLLVIATLMIPGHITLIPNYLNFARFEALDSFVALIMPTLASGFSIFFLRQFMMGIPQSLDDAARIDGASHWKILWTIIVPLSWPAIIVVSLFAFLNEWNSFIWPLIATTSDEMRTVQIGLRFVFRAEEESSALDWPLIMACSTIVLAPLVVVFVIAERHLIRGITMGSFR